MTWVAAAALMLVHSGALAMSLGRLSVQSALGEPLRAEIDVNDLTPDEAGSLKAALASPDAFRAAGVDFNAVLSHAQATLVRRPDGRMVLRLSSERAVTEPFLDVLLDFSWNSGRLQRSYTLLIDPPVTASTPAPVAVAAAPIMSAAPSGATPPVAPPSGAPVVRAKTPKPVSEEPAPTARSYRVRAGDTLSAIAAAQVRPGISLDQMLVALYRNNAGAFNGGNMNRLKAGAVLNLGESQAQADAVPQAEARRVIQAQSADFAAFRQRLAGAAPEMRGNGPAHQASGKVETQVQDRKTDNGQPPDKLLLSKGGLKASGTEAKISKEAERQAAQARVAELARNVAELKGLSASGPAAPIRSEAPTPAASLPAVPVAAAVAPVVTAAPSAAASMAAAASVPAVAASRAAPKGAAPKPAPVPQTGLLDALSDNPFVMPGAAMLAALLAGLGFMRWRRKGQDGAGETSFIESKLQPDSFFGASGGQRVDTRDGPSSNASSSLSYSLSQLDAIGDVDPVAEADVYLAYGRDLQAEEILKEALRSDGARPAIRVKLLEVYAKRADVKGFEAQARQLHELTGGEGEDWQRAADMGRQLDPSNPLYATSAAQEPVAATLVDAAPLAGNALPDSRFMSDPTLPLDVPAAAADAGAPGSNFDIDIDLDAPSQLSGLEQTRPLDTASGLPDLVEPEPTSPGALDGFRQHTTPGELDVPEMHAAPAKAADEPLEFTLNLPDDVPPHKEAQASGPVDFDFGDLSLDLDTPPPAGGSAEADLDAGSADPLARKIELADEFRRIGDIEGARDLLGEVVSKADGALRVRAQSLLDELK